MCNCRDMNKILLKFALNTNRKLKCEISKFVIGKIFQIVKGFGRSRTVHAYSTDFKEIPLPLSYMTKHMMDFLDMKSHNT